MVGRIIVCSLLFSLNAAGEEADDSVRTNDNVSTFWGRVHQVQHFLDSAARAKVDPSYIEVPDKPWRVILRQKSNVVYVDYDNSYDFLADKVYTDWKLSFNPPVASSIGFWVGYRGTGISYSKSIAKNAGRYYSFSSTGAKYGLNFRLRRFNTSAGTLKTTTYAVGEVVDETDTEDNMASPVWIRSVYANGYYVFNGRRYSQAAAYNQSVIQRRSAGSLLVGATWYQSDFDYSDTENLMFIIFGNKVGRINVRQANLGLGYGYNFVPCRGLVINAMAMPTISLYNRVKVYKYDSNYDILLNEKATDDYGEWNHETKTWANGKTHKPLAVNGEEVIHTDDDVWETGTEINHSMFQLNIDLRLGIAYNWRNFFIGYQMQLNNFNYHKEKSTVNLTDAYGRLSLGVRL